MRAIQAVAVALTAAIVTFAPRADTQEAAGKVRASRIFSATTTASGQPIVLPKTDAEVVVWMYDVPVGARLQVHKHPFQRYAYVLQGKLRVATADNSRTWEYKAGDFVVEMVDAWHYGTNVGSERVRLLVIDQVEKGQANTILR